MARAALIDPATGQRVPFLFNPSAQDTGARVRKVNELVPAAAGWGPCTRTLQQGERGPLTMRFTGLAPTAEQHAALIFFRRLSEQQTVHFEHPDGTAAEVLVTAYEPERKAVVKGPRGGLEVWNYSLELQVARTSD